MSDDIEALARRVIDTYRDKGLTLGTAESCTGGLIAGALTGVSGSSHVLDRGFVTYSNDSKTDLLDVDGRILRDHGAVSEETARAMAGGVLTHAPVDCAVAVTGIAGPGGAKEGKPVGLVHLAAARHGCKVVHERHVFEGDRAAVRGATVKRALELLLALVE
ncbi:MAG: damage-inducible protein CinA [Rhodospirillales bacterium CG15_BIG_FIL_POST_REV_8_21_14_020_66_15]|nr:MAG: damage-inducible protein CinA [Rhodospirillales bacterium CG15_BIG_FIL_POST_REV_8_21_14_020_66_15]